MQVRMGLFCITTFTLVNMFAMETPSRGVEVILRKWDNQLSSCVNVYYVVNGSTLNNFLEHAIKPPFVSLCPGINELKYSVLLNDAQDSRTMIRFIAPGDPDNCLEFVFKRRIENDLSHLQIYCFSRVTRGNGHINGSLYTKEFVLDIQHSRMVFAIDGKIDSQAMDHSQIDIENIHCQKLK